jgi:hypothetical protein
MPDDQPRLCADQLHACHARVTIRINEVNVSSDKDILIIRAPRCESQRGEKKDLNYRDDSANYAPMPNPHSFGNKFTRRGGQSEILAENSSPVNGWTLNVGCSRIRA